MSSAIRCRAAPLERVGMVGGAIGPAVQSREPAQSLTVRQSVNCREPQFVIARTQRRIHDDIRRSCVQDGDALLQGRRSGRGLAKKAREQLHRRASKVPARGKTAAELSGTYLNTILEMPLGCR